MESKKGLKTALKLCILGSVQHFFLNSFNFRNKDLACRCLILFPSGFICTYCVSYAKSLRTSSYTERIPEGVS